jgi:hypothetical protein
MALRNPEYNHDISSTSSGPDLDHMGRINCHAVPVVVDHIVVDDLGCVSEDKCRIPRDPKLWERNKLGPFLSSFGYEIACLLNSRVDIEPGR